MALSRDKWHKFADSETDLHWTPGQVAEITVADRKLCVARVHGEWFGFAHTCPHAGAPMTDAYLKGDCHIVCPVHQLKFNLRNGRDSNGDGYKLKTYPVESRADGLYVGLDEGGLLKKW